MFLLRSLPLLAALVLLASPGAAQVATSRLQGTVQDETGALVPGASVEVLNVKTQSRAQTKTGAQGDFIFPSLPPGDYSLSASAAGFRTSVRRGLFLTVGETVTEVIRLEVGSVSEQVVVEATVVRVQTSDAQLGQAITLRDIEVLPQLGRLPLALAVFNPGVQIDPTDSSFSRVNGTRQGANNTTLDGIEVNDPVAPRLGLAMTPNTTDTVAEFRVVTSGGKAEYGRNAGAQVQMVTRSGSNKFHGALFDYHRNTALNANTFFSNQTGQSRPKFIQNSFGGRFEGPIRRDKTFFFGNYEGRRTRQEVVRNRTVLTPDLKQGVFRWRAPGSAQVQSFDLVRNDPRGIGIDREVKKNLALLPGPNNFDIGDGLNTGGFRFNNPANSYSDQFTIKADHDLWNGHRAFFRWSWMRTYSIDSLNNADATFPGQPHGRQGGRRWGWSAGSDWTLTPNVINELRVGGQHTTSDFYRPRLPQALLISNTFTDPLATAFSQGRSLPLIEITDNLSKISGKHALKAGVQARLITQHGFRDDNIYPNVYFSRNYGNVPPGAIGPAGSAISSADRQRFENHYNELLGRMSDVFGRFYSDLERFQPAGTSRKRTHDFNEYGFFLQDDWKVNSRLTLNLGLRYELFGVPVEANGLQGTLDGAARMNFANTASNLTVVKGAPFFNNDHNNLAPRLGFAWDVSGAGKTAIRANWGLFYDRMINAVFTPVDLNTPGFVTDVRVMPNQAANSDRRVADGIPTLPQPSSPVLRVPADRQATATVIQPNLRTGYVMHSSFTIQQEIFRNTVVEAAYVGSKGVKLFMHMNLNQPRIHEGFLDAFRELQAFRAGAAISPNNPLVRIFGSAANAVSRIGASVIDQGAVGTAADTVDRSYYSSYGAAGLPDTYLRNYPQFNLAYLGTNDGRSAYDSFQLMLRRQQGALKFNLNYTFSKSIDNWANEGNGTSAGSVIDYRNLRLNRGISDFDKTHSLNSSVMYTLPVGHGRRLLSDSANWVDSLIGGWEAGVLNIWQSGRVFSVTSGRATGPNPGASARANYQGSRSIGKVDRRGNGVFYFSDEQKAAFTFPGAGEIGSSGRNAFRGPRFFNLDASLLKRFRVREGTAVTFRVEAYNLFNTVNFGQPGTSILTPASFGRISSTIGTAGGSGARLMQMALRFEF